MNAQQDADSLLAEYVIDADVFINFWVFSEDEPFGKDVHESAWSYVEKQIEAGRIIAPELVREEALKHGTEQLKEWVSNHEFMFVKQARELLEPLKEIAAANPIYKTKGSLTDCSIVALAKARKLAVITSEKEEPEGSRSSKNPKIPNVCNDVGVTWHSVTGFFRAENQSF